MPGFESCCLTSRREIRRRLLSLVGLALIALAATRLVSTPTVENRSEQRAEETSSIETEVTETSQLPEGEVVQAQRALFKDFEAKP